MAYLNTVVHRPSCVVVGLPKRVHQTLEADLGDRLSLSTCSLDQLESAVDLRGATMAIIGASPDSLEIAERLSHRKEPLKVFLVHHRDLGPQRPEVNGFAGIFDLRLDLSRLTRTIRQAIPEKRGTGISARRPVVASPLHFVIAMQERIENRSALLETMLEGYLELSGSDSGVLLLKDDLTPHEFKVASARGDFLPEREAAVELAGPVLRQLSAGEMLSDRGGISYAAEVPWGERPIFTLGCPIQVGGALTGCFLGVDGEAGGALEEYALGVAAILRQLKARDIARARTEQLAEVRRLVSGSWALADGEGRVLFREGDLPKGLFEGMKIKPPRLRDAIARAQAGKSSSVQVQEDRLSCRPLLWKDRPHAVFTLEDRPAEPVPRKENRWSIAELRQRLTPLFPAHPHLETLLADLESPAPTAPVSIEKLAASGICFGPEAKTLPPEIRARVLLLNHLFSIATEAAVACSVAVGNPIAVTFEVKEESLAKCADWPQRVKEGSLFISAAAALFSDPEWIFGTYGVQLRATGNA